MTKLITKTANKSGSRISRSVAKKAGLRMIDVLSAIVVNESMTRDECYTELDIAYENSEITTVELRALEAMVA